MPRSSVIEPALDPTPDADYVMTHPAFVLAWPDGRLFLFDAGAAFSHLHIDHTAGLAALCAARDAPLPVFQTPPQHEGGNYTTRAGRAQIEQAGCAQPRRLAPAPLAAVPGFPGLWLVPVAGHTPGSQMLVARLSTPGGVQVWVFTGDAVNHRDAARLELPKPRLYSLLVVPEDTQRLRSVRRLLAELMERPGVRLAVSHDAQGLDALGAPPWPPFLPAGG